MSKIFISTSTFAEFPQKPLQLLNSEGFKVDLNSFGRKLSEEEINKALRNCDGVIAGTEVYNEYVLSKIKRLKVISRLGVGLDNIDFEFVKKRNIKVFKTQTTPAPAVAELILGLILDLLRKISIHNYDLKNGLWKKQIGSLLSGI